ncbi:transcript variant X8 [Nothobranchius furzeri]|uniref:Transcript variant X8 n=1 Tax=Nothobranchius furzeri TaxID=105023 RepID=A0A9D3BLG4_NOTFU|nr:transcript variant X8 [Nothobranchius furzeri]
MLGAAGTKLDLSKLTDEEAKHVWDVIQRDFDLRKKEEDRLGELKSKIQKEDTKIELLGTQSSLTDSYCIRCLQPFKFLVNAKRQCLDCRFHVCRSCSHYSRKEHGWVCDPCHMARVLRIGTLEWYHENVRARFKRFGSAKVMRSLFKRLSGEHSCSQSDLGDGYEEHGLEASDSQQFKDATGVYDFMDAGERGSEFTQACMAVVFHQIQEQQRGQDQDMVPHHDDLVFVENHAVPSRSVSRLIYSSCGSGNAGGPRGGSSFLPDLDDSEGEEDPCERYPVYHSHPEPCSHASQESLDSAPQISDLNRRMFAVETFLNRLEQKVVPPNFGSLTPQSISPPPPAPPQWEEVENEEQLLRQKLHELTDNISDQSSDEDGFSRPDPSQEVPTRRSPQMKPKPSRIPTRPTSSASTRSSREEEELSGSQKTDLSIESLERKERPLQEASMGSFRGSTALLVELEDQVAQAAADVQNAQSQVSYIENRIAALKAASIPSEKRQKSAIPIQARRLSHNFPTNSFVRSSVYRGSLTQRNPVAKPKPQPPCAKPLMTPGS